VTSKPHKRSGPHGPDPDIDAEALLKIMRDPMRRRVLFLLAGRRKGMSIRQVADLLKESPRRVRHYIGALVDSGFVEVEGERPRRGTIERTYRARSLPPLWVDGWPGELPASEMKMFQLDVLRLVFDTVTEAIVSGVFLERPGWCGARTWREVDEQGWKELTEIHQRVLREVIDTVERAEDRLEGSDEAPIQMISALLLYEALPLRD
jgi:DNA-binding transcriptional ArsR family regulator